MSPVVGEDAKRVLNPLTVVQPKDQIGPVVWVLLEIVKDTCSCRRSTGLQAAGEELTCRWSGGGLMPVQVKKNLITAAPGLLSGTARACW